MRESKSLFAVFILFVLTSACIAFLLAGAVAEAAPKILMQRANLESPTKMRVYEVRVVPVDKKLVGDLARQHNLEAPVISKEKEGQFALFKDKATKATRLMVNETRGHIVLLPSLEQIATAPAKLLGKDQAIGAADDYVKKLKLVPRDASQVGAKQVTTLSMALLEKEGGQQKGGDKLQTVLFQRTLDGKPVMGKGSQLTVDLGDQGKVVGMNRTWNGVTPSKVKPEFLSSNEVYDRIESKIKQDLGWAEEVKVGTPRSVYVGNDRKFVQPAWFFEVEIGSSNPEIKAFYAGVVEGLKNSPEPVSMPLDLTEKPGESQEPKASLSLTGLAYAGGADPSVGRYAVRNDSWDWVDDANDFKRGLENGHCSGCPAITFPQWYWAYPYQFTTAKNSYCNSVDICLEEGHGAPWLFCTLRNCCDCVNLNSASMTGYGGNAGGKLDYWILKSCSSVPAPPDRSNWADPYWRIFKGLHQVIGFRTTMYINDNISDNFGYYLGRACTVLSSWFAATNSSGSYSWNRFWGASVKGYGAVVMIPGHEADNIYYVSSLPNATSTGLTIWYQH